MQVHDGDTHRKARLVVHPVLYTAIYLGWKRWLREIRAVAIKVSSGAS